MNVPTLDSIAAAMRGKQAAATYEERLAAFRAELAANPVEPLATPQPPRRRPRGKSRNKFGRTGPHPDAPKRFDREASWTGTRGESEQGVAGRPGEPRIVVPPEIRSKLEREAATAVLLDEEPEWQAGQVVPVIRRGQGDERDPVLMLEVQSLEWFEARAIDTHRAQLLGYSTLGEFAKARYPNVEGNAQFRVRHLQSDERPVWFAMVIRAQVMRAVSFALDDEHGRPVEGVVAPRWLGRGREAYVENEHRGILDAGICVEPEFQAAITERAQGSIRAGAVKGVLGSEKARDVGRQIHHERVRRADSTRETGPRRKPRKATIDRRLEASPDEIAAFLRHSSVGCAA